MALRNKDLISIHDLSVGEVATILDVSRKLKKKQKLGEPHEYLKGKTLAMIFSKASTRTRVSFETGFHQLGGHPIYMSEATSQIGRGEPVKDTARVLSRFVDGIMIRTFSHDAVKELADYATVPVINGLTDLLHPCQALTDMFTILEHGKQFKNLKMAIIGDILYSRVARSNIAAWTKLGADVHVAGPMTLIPHDIQELGVTVHKRVEDAIEGADVVDVLRIQLERQDKAMFPTPREYARIYGVNEERMKLAKPDCLVMHPGPMNRGLEISWDTGYSDQAVIREQVTNGVAVRMAVLFLTIMGGKPVENAN